MDGNAALNLAVNSLFKKPRKRDKRHLEAIAGLPSVISGIEPVQVCHIRYSDAAMDKINPGMQQKPDDRWTLPLTPEEHDRQHSMNERAFWKGNGINATLLAHTLYSIWSDISDPYGAQEVMRRIIMKRLEGKQ